MPRIMHLNGILLSHNTIYAPRRINLTKPPAKNNPAHQVQHPAKHGIVQEGTSLGRE